MQGEIDRVAANIKELETQLAEMTTRNETLATQHRKEAEKCHHMKVMASF